MKAGGGYVLADMLCQFRVRACADWTRATDRVRRRLLERAIDAGARDLPHPRDAHHTVTASQGGRAILAHRLDLLWAKGRSADACVSPRPPRMSSPPDRAIERC